MAMTPVAVDKGAIQKKLATERAGNLSGFETQATQGWQSFKAEENKKWEEFVKSSEADTQNFYNNVNQLGKAMTDKGVSAEQLQATLFQIGFQNAMQGLPPSHIRAAISGMASQLLAPENKEAVDGVADQMKNVFTVPSKDEVIANLKEQAAAQGVPADKMDEVVKQYEPQIDKGLEKAKNAAEDLKTGVAAQAEALNAANVPEDKKLGAFVLTGYMAGKEKRELLEQQQGALMEMMQQLQAGGGQAESAK